MASNSTRKSAVAGTFYINVESGLRKQIEWCFRHDIGPGELPTVVNSSNQPRSILGIITPHAGYAYSGPVAAHGFYELANDGKPDLVVLIGPNHRGWGPAIAISHTEVWHTPLGDVPVNTRVARQIARSIPGVELDDVAHALEHSIEVQLPFLQYLFGNNFSIVPVAMLPQNPMISEQLGRAIAAAVSGRNAIIIASTDFSHYETHDVATKKDHMAIERILQLDTVGLSEVIQERGITICGSSPVIAAIAACRAMAAENARLLRYATSGDITGDLSYVVGYASLKIQ